MSGDRFSLVVRRVVVLTALAVTLFGMTGPAAAQAPVRLVESCRIAAPASQSLQTATEQLKRCEKPAARDHLGTAWISYDKPALHIAANKTYRITLDNHRSSGVDLWAVTREGDVQHVAYDPAAADREWSPGNYMSVLVTPTGDLDRIIVRLRDLDGASYARSPLMARAKNFAALERDLAALYGMGVGMLALTILFHMSLFFAMRKRFQLIYCAHIALLLAYALCYSGIIRLVAPGLTATQISYALSFTMAAATATGIAFIVEFLGNITPTWLRRWALAAGAASAVSAFAVILTPMAWSAPVYTAANLIAVHAILLAAAIIVGALIRGHSLAGIVLLGWTLPIIVSLLYPARTMGLISDAAIPDGLLMLATTIECLILSLPVASRIRALRIEHERAAERHTLLERQAHTDVLTGLANRRGFGEALDRAAVAHAEPFQMALLLIDIDHFKRVNDRHGHATGDAILRHVAAHVARVAGSGAIVGRHGGEEFVVALRGHDLPRASTIAERIRIGMGDTFETERELPAVTVSIGVAAGDSASIESMLHDADCALYRAKNEGRNRVMLADGPLIYAAAA